MVVLVAVVLVAGAIVELPVVEEAIVVVGQEATTMQVVVVDLIMRVLIR
jgi:hypothetical protein